MLKKIYLLLISLLIFPLVNNAQVEDSILSKGNNFYINENYEAAINSYLEIVESGFISEDLFFNLGNAYYKQNKIAPAILYYEKAKQLAPNNKDIRYNLMQIN
jgi:tetratricopeptide (TPR) repeat protein